jgi:hypothetical protein
MSPPIEITADEVNQIIHAYLKDAGTTKFSHVCELSFDNLSVFRMGSVSFY